MKIKKNELVMGLTRAKKFTGDSFEIAKCVLIDGAEQRIIATDFRNHVVIPIEISDYLSRIEPENESVEIVFPDNELKEELNSLKKSQLDDLAEYAGVDIGKKSDMVESIFQASLESAQKEQEKNEKLSKPITIKEKICIQPNKLLDIVKSFDGQKEELINISVDDFYLDYEYPEASEAVSISIGPFFQKIPVKMVSDFPSISDMVLKEYSYLNDIDPKALKNVVAANSTESDEKREHVKTVFFDLAHKVVSATDGKRLHSLKLPENFCDERENLMIDGSILSKACDLDLKSKKIQIFISEDQKGIKFVHDGVSVYTHNDFGDFEYPELDSFYEWYKNGLDYKVTIDKKNLKSALDQASAISKDRVSFVFNGGLDANAVDEMGVYHRNNVPYSGGKDDSVIEEPVERHFNSKFIIDALKAMGQQLKIFVDKSQDDGPIILHNDDNFFGCIMPLRV